MQISGPQGGAPGAWTHRHRFCRIRRGVTGDRCQGCAAQLQDHAHADDARELRQEMIKRVCLILIILSFTPRIASSAFALLCVGQ